MSPSLAADGVSWTIFPCVLCLTGMELIFFIVACMVLCFGFVTSLGNRLMFLLLLNSACIVSRHSPLLTLPPHQVGWWWTKVWEGTQLRHLSQTDQSDADTPYHTVSCAAIKLEGDFPGVAIAQDLDGHSSACDNGLLLRHFFFFVSGFVLFPY